MNRHRLACHRIRRVKRAAPPAQHRPDVDVERATPPQPEAAQPQSATQGDAATAPAKGWASRAALGRPGAHGSPTQAPSSDREGPVMTQLAPPSTKSSDKAPGSTTSPAHICATGRILGFLLRCRVREYAGSEPIDTILAKAIGVFDALRFYGGQSLPP